MDINQHGATRKNTHFFRFHSVIWYAHLFCFEIHRFHHPKLHAKRRMYSCISCSKRTRAPVSRRYGSGFAIQFDFGRPNNLNLDGLLESLGSSGWLLGVQAQILPPWKNSKKHPFNGTTLMLPLQPGPVDLPATGRHDCLNWKEWEKEMFSNFHTKNTCIVWFYDSSFKTGTWKIMKPALNDYQPELAET